MSMFCITEKEKNTLYLTQISTNFIYNVKCGINEKKSHIIKRLAIHTYKSIKPIFAFSSNPLLSNVSMFHVPFSCSLLCMT